MRENIEHKKTAILANLSVDDHTCLHCWLAAVVRVYCGQVGYTSPFKILGQLALVMGDVVSSSILSETMRREALSQAMLVATNRMNERPDETFRST